MADSPHDAMFDHAAEAFAIHLPEGEELKGIAIVAITSDQTRSYVESFGASQQEAHAMLGALRVLDAELTDTLRPKKAALAALLDEMRNGDEPKD